MVDCHECRDLNIDAEKEEKLATMVNALITCTVQREKNTRDGLNGTIAHVFFCRL